MPCEGYPGRITGTVSGSATINLGSFLVDYLGSWSYLGTNASRMFNVDYSIQTTRLCNLEQCPQGCECMLTPTSPINYRITYTPIFGTTPFFGISLPYFLGLDVTLFHTQDVRTDCR